MLNVSKCLCLSKDLMHHCHCALFCLCKPGLSLQVFPLDPSIKCRHTGQSLGPERGPLVAVGKNYLILRKSMRA